jgi:hypothetical protein
MYVAIFFNGPEKPTMKAAREFVRAFTNDFEGVTVDTIEFITISPTYTIIQLDVPEDLPGDEFDTFCSMFDELHPSTVIDTIDTRLLGSTYKKL